LNIHAYDAGSIGGRAYRQYITANSVELDKKLVEAGYAVMGVNPAGTGCSGGAIEYTRPQLGMHGAEAVEFAASQPWSDGNVGMTGWSYGGASQLATAQFQPPHLRAIVPGHILTNYREALAPGGVPAPGFVTPWRVVVHAYWTQVVAQTAREEGDDDCLRQIETNVAAEDSNSVMKMVLAHPLRDDYMDSFDLGKNIDRINVPVLSLEAFQDQAVTVRGGHFQSRLDPAKMWLLQTNGTHDMYRSAAFAATVVQFLDRFVKGRDNGFERNTPRITVWMEAFESGTGVLERRSSARPRWAVHRNSIRTGDLIVKEYHLGAGNVLADAVSPAQAEGFDYPGAGVAVNDIVGTTFWGPLPGDWKKSSLAHTSAPLAQDMMVYGPGSADLWITANGGDADVQVTVTEVRPDGQEIYVQRGWLRLSNRAIDTARSTPLLPMHLDRPEQLMPLLPGRPVLARVEINKMGHYFRRGSRLRVWIDTPAQTGGLVFDTFTQKQRIHVLRNAKYDSLLRIGVLKDVKGPQSPLECGVVLMQPCRPDPLSGD
jgi:predicted acyl esterase